MELNFNLITSENIAINCKTEEEAKILCDFMHKKGFEWRMGQNLSKEVYWERLKERTCYCFSNYKTMYNSIENYKRKTLKIISFDEVLLNKKLQKEKPQKRKVKHLKEKNEKLKDEIKDNNLEFIINILKKNENFKKAALILAKEFDEIQ